MLINFWNGNKSPTRQDYEYKLLETVLDGNYQIINDKTDYPKAEDEGDIFNKGADVLVTVAGNTKFAPGNYLSIDIPLCKGLLGHRVLIVREQDVNSFDCIAAAQLRDKVMGIAATWADAELFRENGYNVNEKGDLAGLFTMLENKECDYLAFGANEIQGLYDSYCSSSETLAIEPKLLVYYPFPLVFYVNPNKPELFEDLKAHLIHARDSGLLEPLFDQYYGQVVDALKLNSRHLITLQNPELPEAFSTMTSDIIDN